MFEYIIARLYNERKKDGDMNERKEKVMGNACHFSNIIPAWFMDIF